MNENPEGTANPLSQNPGVGPGVNSSPLDANPADAQPLEQIVQDVQATSAANAANTSANVTQNPMARPMEQAPVISEEKPKKKKTGLIIGIIIAAVVLIGGIAAAIVVMNLNRGDVVAKAMEKIITGNAPSNVAIDGTFTLTPNDEESPITNLTITLDSEGATNSLLNNSVAKITANFTTGDEVSFEFDEIYAANGELFLKLDGVTGAIEDYTAALQNTMPDDPALLDTTIEGTTEDVTIDTTEVAPEVAPETAPEAVTEDAALLDEPVSDESMGAFGFLGEYMSILETVDGEWLRISLDDLNSLTGAENPEEQSSTDTTCLVNFVSNIQNYGNSLAETYSKNPFIASTTEGVTIASKSGEPVYKVTINSEKLDAFMNEFKNSNLISDLMGCMGYEGATVNIDNVVADLSNLPDFYVEVDKDFNFTRLYFVSDLKDSDLTLTTDLGFTYPTNINVAEPEEYRNLSDVIQEIFTTMYVAPGSEVTVEEVVTE